MRTADILSSSYDDHDYFNKRIKFYGLFHIIWFVISKWLKLTKKVCFTVVILHHIGEACCRGIAYLKHMFLNSIIWLHYPNVIVHYLLFANYN
jgi:hypothetical protein